MMLILFDVWQTGINASLLCSVDITDNTDVEQATILSDLKDIYGPDCKYYRHLCGHACRKVCTQVEV